MMLKSFKVEIKTVPEHNSPVAEIWSDDVHIAQVQKNKFGFAVKFFTGSEVKLDATALGDIIHEAKEHLTANIGAKKVVVEGE
ncbi:MAG TPA: hypothetical protein DHW71_03450 [Gammaproteobacteria bacterium]|nr:hypothetical protein [Gammaproteobacteria bacterium]MEC8009320.1 hypothetical protein [Pseudomonadota bacterium]HBF09116.1 hypothetical protein [Gammaproteobacteria bacterium]HCK92014.1 hypothetical protein [Gammaproteobacteria bacterium]|tara:strand:- start:1862 stop:2110 length:249 start_codon:yes stop_codon:yes gene_type:complete